MTSAGWVWPASHASRPAAAARCSGPVVRLGAVLFVLAGLALAGLAVRGLANVTMAGFTGTSSGGATFAAAPVFPPSAITPSSGLDAQVALTWNAVGGASDYEVQWRTNGTGSWSTIPSTSGATSTTVSGLANNTTYEFQVATIGPTATSDWSASVLGTPRQWAQVSVGEWSSCAVTVSGRAYCWGKNAVGQIGDGTYGVDRLTPVPVDTTTGLTTTNVASVSVDGLFWDSNTAHACAVTTGGSVYCWGSNGNGELGDGTQTRRLTPTLVSGLSGVVQVSAGNQHTCAVTSAGTAYCWGNNGASQLGDGTTTLRKVPTAVNTTTGLTASNVARISAGGSHTCAVTTGGQAYCWGANSTAQLGDGTTTTRATPTPVDTTTGLTSTNAAQIATGWQHTCAVTTAGQAYCWGDDETSPIGNNTWSTWANPVKLPAAVDTTTGLTTTNVARVETSRWGTCGTTTAGRAYCWGTTAGNGQLGNNSTSGAMVPVPVYTGSGLTTTNVRAVDGGDYSFCAVTKVAAGGTVYCWGLSDYVGDGTTGASRLAPTPLDATAIPALAATPTGLAATSWQSGQVPLSWTAVSGAADYQVQWRTNGVGNWTTTTSTTGTGMTITGLTNTTTYEFQVRSHNAGGFSAWSASVLGQPNTPPAGLTATSGLDGQVSLSWTARAGATNYQVQWRVNGTGSWTANGWTGGPTTSTVSGLTNNTTYEFQVQASNSYGTGSFSASVPGTPRQWAQVTASGNHTCAVTVSGRAYCWGLNSSGQLGDGTTSNRLQPTPVDTSSGLTATNVASIAADYLHTCAVTTAGRAYCWGSNSNGQLGNSSTTPSLVPSPVTTGGGLTTTNVGSLDTGYLHTCAVTKAGQLYCWGSNGHGQIGDTTTTQRTAPTAVSTATGLSTTNVARVSAGYGHTCAVTTGGAAYCWGYNIYGAVGDTTAGTDRLVPTAVDTTTGLTATNVAKISAGAFHTCAVTTGGQAYCWGYNANSQLGDTTAVDRWGPVAVDTTTGLTASTVASISSGNQHTCAVTTAGGAYCWGYDGEGEVGDGTSGTNRGTPTAVSTATGFTGTAVASISAGANHTCAVTTAATGGTTWCWGQNTEGRVGDATSGTNRLFPVLLGTASIPAAPATPAGLAATSSQGTQVPLTWSAATGATEYQVQYRVNGTGGWTVTGWQTGSTATVTGLTTGTTYEFQVQAHGAGGNSAWSASVTATP